MSKEMIFYNVYLAKHIIMHFMLYHKNSTFWLFNVAQTFTIYANYII